jgi:hypothetical protein
MESVLPLDVPLIVNLEAGKSLAKGEPAKTDGAVSRQ